MHNSFHLALFNMIQLVFWHLVIKDFHIKFLLITSVSLTFAVTLDEKIYYLNWKSETNFPTDCRCNNGILNCYEQLLSSWNYPYCYFGSVMPTFNKGKCIKHFLIDTVGVKKEPFYWHWFILYCVFSSFWK